MANVTSESMLDVITQIQADVAGSREWKSEVRLEKQSMRMHVQAASTDISNIYAGFGPVEDRLGRIEKRLGLVDVDLN